MIRPLGHYILDEEGKPVLVEDILEWAQWFEHADRTIAYDELEGGRISTVFLSVDHGFFGSHPILWETMIFGGEHDGYQRRYRSKDGAL